MDIVTAVGGLWLTTLAWLAGLAVTFGFLAGLSPCNPGMYWWRDLRAARTDIAYWLALPLATLAARGGLIVLGAAVLAGRWTPLAVPLNGAPAWLLALEVLLIQDLLLYWVHRGFHTGPGWRFHAIHHSPGVLDWMSAARFHPVNHLAGVAAADVVVLVLGYPPGVVAVLAPFNLAYSAMVHANLNWTFGPLRFVLASPVFHRWHHAGEGTGRNFASTFPFLDLIFGTFHMPAAHRPVGFGAGDPAVPSGFCGQLVHPFRRAKRRQATAHPTAS